MSRAKVKKVKINMSSIKDEGLAEMFNQMLSNGDVNMSIAYPKYIKIKSICCNLIKLFTLLARSPPLKGAEYSSLRQDIETFCTTSQQQVDTIFSMDFSKYEWNLAAVEKELKTKFSKCYEQMKTSKLVNSFVVMCDRLVSYKKNFLTLDALDHRFIVKMAGVEWAPFTVLPTFNLKLLITNAVTSVNNQGGKSNDTVTFFMTVLHKAYTLSRELYEILQSPDIDIDEFVNVIMNSIDELQKRPELSRCKDAFAKIKQSVQLLKTNFSDYYRDFIGTNDNTIMMQNFILDVSKSTDADAKVAHQFRVIISYYQKLAANQTKDPRVKALFEKVNASFAHMDKNTKNIVSIDKTADELNTNEINDTDEFITMNPAPISELNLDSDIIDLSKFSGNTEVHDNFIITTPENQQRIIESIMKNWSSNTVSNDSTLTERIIDTFVANNPGETVTIMRSTDNKIQRETQL